MLGLHGLRRGRKALWPTVEEAVRDLTFVEHVVVHRRGSRPGDAPVAVRFRASTISDVQAAA
ncbi:MAG: hypothetical protein IPJ04_16705 [Candidatus Eisenbacteria bacterium]|nr:hypothetical protein [Candidatus Eisenbacteria bacterium]